MRKWIIWLLVLAIVGGGIGFYLYNKPKTSMEAMKTDNVLAPSDLVQEFENDEAAAEIKYLDKTVEVSGVVREITDAGIILDSGNDLIGVLCEFENPNDLKDIKVKDNVKIKGICTGKLLDVVLSRSIILK
ncbi:MAG: hypothetical protein IPG18_14920 [Saprospiraceae bacterium]|nr:hypothetical protein [Saprospiraceae bacterium]MBK6566453.1 hypothetical protein [Saprospiraceae bacterium]MBK6783492.1 hypothetical protein [Saprospiraceae bacterium]